MPHVAECASCHGRFTAKTRAAKYCSDRCRKRASRAPAPPPMRREGAPLVALPPRSGPGSSLEEIGLLALTRRRLEAASRLDTWEGAAAVALAQILDSGVQDTGSSIAALIREHRIAMGVALDGAQVEETPLERIRRRIG